MQMWLRQQEGSAVPLAAIETHALASLTDAEALAISKALLSAAPWKEMSVARRETSGLIEQQRLFSAMRAALGNAGDEGRALEDERAIVADAKGDPKS
jgi:hypothetical protein